MTVASSNPGSPGLKFSALSTEQIAFWPKSGPGVISEIDNDSLVR